MFLEDIRSYLADHSATYQETASLTSGYGRHLSSAGRSLPSVMRLGLLHPASQTNTHSTSSAPARYL